jgi:hypothetical protein
VKATPESESHGGRRGGDWVKKVSLATLLTGGRVKVDNNCSLRIHPDYLADRGETESCPEDRNTIRPSAKEVEAGLGLKNQTNYLLTGEK